MFDPSGEGVVFGTAGNHVEVGKDVTFGGVHATHVFVTLTVFDSVARYALHGICVVVIGNVEEHFAVVGEHGMRIGIGVALHVGDWTGSFSQTAASAALPYSFFEFQIVTALHLGTAVDGDHGATVLK